MNSFVVKEHVDVNVILLQIATILATQLVFVTQDGLYRFEEKLDLVKSFSLLQNVSNYEYSISEELPEI
jgi:hypothetical protein